MMERRQHMEMKEMQEERMIMWARKLMKAVVVQAACLKLMMTKYDGDEGSMDTDEGYRGRICKRWQNVMILMMMIKMSES